MGRQKYRDEQNKHTNRRKEGVRQREDNDGKQDETGVLRQRELEGVVNQHRRHIRCN